MKVLILFLIFGSLYLPAKIKHDSIMTAFQQNPSLTELKKKREAIDRYLVKHSKDVITLVKVPDKKDLVRINNEKWPDQIEYTINLLKNTSGKIIMIDQSIEPESGDWIFNCEHYFDAQGDTFAFEKREYTFNDDVKGGEAHQLIFKYYDSGLRIINESNQFTDKDDKVLKSDKNLDSMFHNNYSIYKNVADCLAGYNIKLSD